MGCAASSGHDKGKKGGANDTAKSAPAAQTAEAPAASAGAPAGNKVSEGAAQKQAAPEPTPAAEPASRDADAPADAIKPSRFPQAIVTTQWLADKLGAGENLRVFDCTTVTDTSDPTHLPYKVVSGQASFETKHIKGAEFLDLINFSKSADEVGRDKYDRPLNFMALDSAEFLSRLGKEKGVEAGTHIVLYTQGKPSWATRVWWMLYSAGYAGTYSVLDGGLAKWVAEGRATEEGPSAASHPAATLAPDESLVPTYKAFVGKTEVQQALADGHPVLHALPLPSYKGATDKFGRAGHITGAVPLPFGSLVNDDDTFVSREAALKLFNDAGVKGSEASVTAYCGGAISASMNVFLALALLGWDMPIQLYDGSLAEWCADADAPMATVSSDAPADAIKPSRFPQAIVTTQWLADKLGAGENLRVFDCTTVTDTSDPTHLPYKVVSGQAGFEEKHIKGAEFLDIVNFSKSADEVGRDKYDRPLNFMALDSAEFLSRLGKEKGIEAGTHIVLYSEEPSWATRVWWMLYSAGYAGTYSVLDGGLAKWVAEGRDTEEGPSAASHPAATLVPDESLVPTYKAFVGKTEVEAAITGGLPVLHTLPLPSYKGATERFGRAGHIKGALHMPFGSLLNDDDTFVSREAALKLFNDAGISCDTTCVTAYCGGGITATVNVFVALTQLGWEMPLQMYDASLSEWCADADAPMEIVQE